MEAGEPEGRPRLGCVEGEVRVGQSGNRRLQTMKTESRVKKGEPTQSSQGEERKKLWGAVSRALTAIALLAIAGVGLILVWGRPENVSFASSFKCERFSPGSPLNLRFRDSTELTFRAPKFLIPRKAYEPNVEGVEAQDSTKQEGDLEVAVTGGGPVAAKLEGDDERTALATLGSDCLIELQPLKEAPGLGEYRVSSEKLRLSMSAWGFTLKTPSDGDFTGFADGISDSLIGEMKVNEFSENQGSGGPPMVDILVPEISGPVSIRGIKDEVAGWSPVLLQAGPSENPLELANGRLWAEKVTSCEVAINGEPVDMETAVDRLQIDVVKANIAKLVLYQDASDGYIAVEISGVSRSIKQNNKELIESVVSRLLSKPSYKSGVAGLFLFFMVFAGGIFLKRAIEVLAETALPKS